MLSERLSEIRKDHGDTQKMLAEKLAVSLATVRAWEQNRSEPNFDMLVRICKMYGTSSDFLLGLTDEDPLLTNREWKTTLSFVEYQELAAYYHYIIWKRTKRTE